MRVLFVALLASILQASPLYAEDEVYRCKNKEGGIVFQQSPCGDDQIVGNGLQHKTWRALRKMTAEMRSEVSSLGADIESIKSCKKNMDVFKKELYAMEKTVTSLVVSYPYLAKSYAYLHECAVCRTSAEAFCRSSDSSLDLAMKDLMVY